MLSAVYRGTLAVPWEVGFGTEVLSGFNPDLSHNDRMKRTVVWLTPPQVRALSALSKKSLAPVSALVRQAVNEFLNKKGKHRSKIVSH